jgi:hypothetical protein
MTKPFFDFLLLWYGSSLPNLSNKHNFLENRLRDSRTLLEAVSGFLSVCLDRCGYITALRNAVSLGTGLLCLRMCSKCIVCPSVPLLLSDLGVIQCRDVLQFVEDCCFVKIGAGSAVSGTAFWRVLWAAWHLETGEQKLCKVGVLCNVTEYTVRSLLYYRLLFILDTSLFLSHILIKWQEKHGSRASRIYLPASWFDSRHRS